MEETSLQQLQCLLDIRHWVENEADFYGKTDEEFLLMFLRGCKFDVEKTKKKIRAYYEKRVKLPKWWANRRINDETIQSLAKLKTVTIFSDESPDQPTRVLFRFSRIGPNLNNFDQYMKMFSIIVDIGIRRVNCQLNGVIFIVDCRNYRYWFASHFLSPMFAVNLLNSFYLSTPIRIKKIVLLNLPLIGYAFYKLLQPLLSQKLKQRIVILGSNWSTLFDHVPPQLLPEEYGGYAGPIQKHDDAFFNEFLSFSDYMAEDSKYGFH